MLNVTSSAAARLLEAGQAHQHAGRLEEAEGLYRQVLGGDPGNAEALYRLALIALGCGQGAQAVPLLERAAQSAPTSADVHLLLGVCLSQCGRPEAAIPSLNRALALRSGADVLGQLGAALISAGRAEEAVGPLQRAAELRPQDADVRRVLAMALTIAGRLTEAVAAGERSAALSRTAGAMAMLASAHASIGGEHIEEAVRVFREAVTLAPAGGAMAGEAAAIESAMLMVMHYSPAIDAETLYRAHRAWDARHGAVRADALASGAAAPSGGTAAPFGGPAAPSRGGALYRGGRERLRVGYLSPDFRHHAVAHFFEPILTHHRGERVETFCYSAGFVEDETTARLKAHAGHWRNIAGVADAAAAEMIAADGLDILVDLAGHSTGNRLPLMALRPAAVQATYLGYPNTTGMEAIDFRLTDAVADPPPPARADALHAERLVRLAPSFLCYQAPHLLPPVATTPAFESRGGVTFACFNFLPKVNRRLVEWWAEILRQVKGSRMLLKSAALGDAGVRDYWLGVFKAAGVAAARIDLRGRVPDFASHLALYGEADIALDTFPYHGTTTTCESLLMGVPVISLAGDSHRSRVGASILRAAGLGELVAYDAEGYVRLAVELAGDSGRLRGLRRGLRERMLVSPLMDAPKFVERLEAVYEKMTAAKE